MILEVESLVKSFGNRRVVNGLSFHLKPGEIVGLLGPNGAGKTTAFYMTCGLLRPESGRVRFKGEDVTQLPMHRRATLGMGYLTQEPSIFAALTVEENILCALEMLPLTKEERQVRLRTLLAELHLTHLAKTKAGRLSGGERRRLEITRSLAQNPSLLLLDEPFANIDPKAIHDVKRLCTHLKERGIAILITDHNAREIFSIVDRAYIVCNGEVMMGGTVQELVQSPEARTHYLGEDFTV